jgi:3',5'-cyclic-nucleotide phosphodiesterase/cAMP-specific phosphodiesterase 4
VQRLQSTYNSANAYHNSLHAIDTANSAAFLLMRAFAKCFTPFEEAGLLIAALSLDIAHPGLSNYRLVESAHTLAL